jgi:hypothetical protein
MHTVVIKDKVLREAAAKGMSDFLNVIVDAINNSIGGKITAETLGLLNSDQITLMAYSILREEVSVGGFVQLIHNGYGTFIFKNPFAKAIKAWGIQSLGRIIQRAHRYYGKYHETIEKDMTDEEFMALYEQCPEFDDYDDEFVENEEKFTSMIACYIDEHITDFVTIEE